MKTKQRILSILLTVIMVVCMLPISAFATETTETTYSVKIFTTVADYGTTTDMGGSISGAGDYKAGDTVTLTATPNSGYCAIGWGSSQNVTLPSGSQTNMTVTFTMPAENVEITGSFRAHTLGVFYENLGDGTHDSYCFYCGVTEGNPTAHSDLTDYTGEGEPDGLCDGCGADMHTHSYSSEWSSDASGHWYECSCGEKADFASHTSSGAATEEVAEVCTICGYEISPKLTHTHSYDTLKYDADNHWYECSCGAKSGETAHSYEYECTTKCSECDYERLATHVYTGVSVWSNRDHLVYCEYCLEPLGIDLHEYDNACDSDCNICGYKRTVTHNYEWNMDAEGHWTECSCGDETEKTAHSYEYECTTKCSECDYERLATHVYTRAVIVDEHYHGLQCRYCNKYLRNDSHEYNNACDSNCNICGYERTVTHNYEWSIDANGHEQKCSGCGEIKVAHAAHTSGGAATNDIPETCCVCGYEIAPKLESTLTIVYRNTKFGGALAYLGEINVTFATGTVVDLSDYWPDTREYTVDGKKYSFCNFVPNERGGEFLYSIVLNHDTTVYACWVVTGNIHTITFNATGGSVVPKKIAERNLAIVNNYVPTRPGYEFLGWSMEDDGTPDDFMGYQLTSDCTLYATWKQVHNISADWSYDAEVHYHACERGERHDESEHKFFINKVGCSVCGYIRGMSIGSGDKTSIEYVPVAGTTLPEGSYLNVRAYEVVEKDVDAIFDATTADGVSDVTEITPEHIGILEDDEWVFSEQYSLRMGDKVTIGGVTYIVKGVSGDDALLYCDSVEYILDKEKGLYRSGKRAEAYSTDTELITIDGVQYVITARITIGGEEIVYFATTDGKSAGYYGEEGRKAYFYPDCTPEALAPKVSVGGVVAIADGQFLVNTSEGVKVASTIWANDIGLHGADGLPVTGVSGTLSVSGIQWEADPIAAHIGATTINMGEFDDDGFFIPIDHFSPFILLDVTDFEVPAVALTGVTVLDNAPGEDTTPATEPTTEAPSDSSNSGLYLGILLTLIALAGGAVYLFLFKKKKQ